MQQFLSDDFLLNNATARTLYHKFAETMPIIDYHCHINPREIYEDRKFENITQVWLGGDHYKWRLMRSAGVEERFITGDAPDREKFQKWADVVGRAIGNPVYHWSHLELKRFFGCHGVLNANTAESIWNLCNERLQGMSVRQMILKSRVTHIATTDDPVDSLKWHRLLREDGGFPVSVLPAWRPDKAMNVEKPDYPEYLDKLTQASGVAIRGFDDLKAALINRMEFFHSMGCRLSDHALEHVPYAPATDEQLDALLRRRLQGGALSPAEVKTFKTGFMLFVAREYHARGWVMQLHYGCKRDNNPLMFKRLGPDTGFDAINNHAPSAEMADFLGDLSRTDQLPKTILYSLNPCDDAAIDSLIGCFQCGPTVGKMQHGSAWWFNDHIDGMSAQIKSLANLGFLAGFVGMLTDSRSFLSYPRHEYFRRILCGIFGDWVDNGLFPEDYETLGKIVQDISYNNAKKFFGFEDK